MKDIMENNDEEDAACKSETNGEVTMELDESLTNGKYERIVTADQLIGCRTIGLNAYTSSPISLNETTGSVIDIQDSTPDVSCEVLTDIEGRTPSAPPRHSDIYITDVYNVSEHVLHGEGDTVTPLPTDELAVAREVVVEPVVPTTAVISVATATTTTTPITEGSNVETRGRMLVCIEYAVSRSFPAGGTVNRIVSLSCSGGGTAGSSSFDSSDGFEPRWPWPPPPRPPRRQHPGRYSHASSTSSASSIASSASALAQANMLAQRSPSSSSEQQSPPEQQLTNERISELRDKWINSREVWRVLDYIDTFLSITPEGTTGVTTSAVGARRAPKVRFDERCHNEEDDVESNGTQRNTRPQNTSGTPTRKRQRKDRTAAATTSDHACDENWLVQYSGGERVFARWRDRKYYSARLVERRDDGKWTVDFYDGDRRAVAEECLLRADERAMVGQRVFASTRDADDDFTVGIVTGCEPDTEGVEGARLMYTVARDDRDVRVPAEMLLLTESQARQVRAKCRETAVKVVVDATVTAPSPAVVNALDDGRPTTRARTRALIGRSDSPIPGGSGALLSARHVSSAAVSSIPSTCTNARLRDLDGHCSDSEDDTSTVSGGGQRNETAAPSLAATVPDDLSAGYVSGLETEVRATYDGCGRLKGKTAAALGPLPPAGSLPFKGLHVVVSCASARVLDAPPSIIEQEEQDGSDALSCTSANENYRFSAAPCVVSRLREQLAAGGATVYVRFDDVPRAPCRNGHALLVTNRPSRTYNYVLCLAAGVRAVCHEWVIKCCQEGRRVNDRQWDLPAGWSLERERWFERPSNTGHGSSSPLRRQLVYVAGEAAGDVAATAFARYWTRVLQLAEANARPLTAEADARRALCVLCDVGYRDELTERAKQLGVPLVTTVWLVQTLVHGQLLDFHKMPCYRPDYLDLD